jgi:hypothetical protein
MTSPLIHAIVAPLRKKVQHTQRGRTYNLRVEMHWRHSHYTGFVRHKKELKQFMRVTLEEDRLCVAYRTAENHLQPLIQPLILYPNYNECGEPGAFNYRRLMEIDVEYHLADPRFPEIFYKDAKFYAAIGRVGINLWRLRKRRLGNQMQQAAPPAQ